METVVFMSNFMEHSRDSAVMVLIRELEMETMCRK